MNKENNTENSQTESQNGIQKYMKDTCGIEVFGNELTAEELESQGYKKLSSEELSVISPLFQLAPQVIVSKMNKVATEQAFKTAIENSYKCILDPSMHLATFKGTSDVFLGAGLDNASNQVRCQARWLKNDEVLSISNVPQVALSAFNALSTVTGQYFMAQINSNLTEIKEGIDGIKQYFDAVRRSKLKTAFEGLNEIIEHIRFIKNYSERTRSNITKLYGIQKVVKENINFNKDQIESITHKVSNADDEKKVADNIEEVQKCLVQYRYAVYILNFSKVVEIYLNDITNVEELVMFQNEIGGTTNQYKTSFEKATDWSKHYLDDNTSLNKASKAQIILSLGSGIAAGILGYKSSGNVKLASQTASLVNDLFDDSRKKKKKVYVKNNDSYIHQMNDRGFVDSSVTAMDKYIKMANQKAEFVSIDGECYIKYIDTEQ